MQIYLVGGAVRDQLLGLPISERDWVVVGATPQEMLKKGFRQVGRDFPVFLHPKTHEEYALARTEKKVGKGYTQFVCHASPEVTLEEDLMRRDLTINAIAMTTDGKIIDPYGGQHDLVKKILRHVSSAFAEDPVRILRVARFAARFPKFKVHPTTNKLMHKMLLAGEVDALVPERVWQEFARALAEAHPEKFFSTLKDCQVLEKLFPEISHNYLAITTTLKHITKLSTETPARFAAMAFHLDLNSVTTICKRYRIPSAHKELAILVAKFKTAFLTTRKNDVDKLVMLLENTDAYRRPERLRQLLLAVKANLKKSNGIIDWLNSTYKTTKTVKLNPDEIATTKPQALKNLLHKKRVGAQ